MVKSDYIQKIKELESQLQQAQRELKLTKLRRQVTPHFLFNSISVAMSLILQAPQTAIRFLRHLAQMYRYLLLYGNEYHVPIEQELEMLSQYYELMSFRHVDSIKLQISTEVKGLRGYPLPPLALQGLLENAIKHNAHTIEEPLLVRLDIENDYLIISNKTKPLISDTESTHRGLAYMNETMELLFNRSLLVENDGKTFVVRIPLVDQSKV